VTEHTDRVIRLFDALAPVYNEILPFFTGFADLHVGWLDPAPGTRALDLGAGSGALTGALLARGCQVAAVDAAPVMVAKLARLHPAAEARTMDVARLDFPDASFDLVTAGFVIHLLDDPAATAAEVHRVLRPGGVFSFSTPHGVEDAPEWDFYPALLEEFKPFIPEGGGRLSRQVDEEELLQAAGFRDLDYTTVEQRLPVADADAFWNWELSHGARAFIDSLPAARRKEFEVRLRAELAKMDPIVYASGAAFDRAVA
jgi:SAM-dependent methyltransferase